jgi:putative lipoic acid-binding regulatory protein
MTDPLCKTKPDIDYPCAWAYRVIGADEQRLRALFAELLGAREHTVRLSHRSARGRFTSLRLELTVTDEADRLRLYEALAAHPAVRVVL